MLRWFMWIQLEDEEENYASKFGHAEEDEDEQEG